MEISSQLGGWDSVFWFPIHFWCTVILTVRLKIA